ncbi:MAG: CapA family protein, partial [Desulfobacteraceae bacterium]|nr:CapA family protein [Desulfobacteraceae bacterium]
KSSGPSHFADEYEMGVVPFDIEKTCQDIKDLREKVDHVIVSPHWGMERFRIPSPEQIEQAHAFVDAGASMVVGHHPHVLQGMQIYKGIPIVYSLGNFLPNKIYWENGEFFTWNKFERTGCILLCEMNANGISHVEQIPVFDNDEQILIEKTGWGDVCLKKVNDFLEQGVTHKKYKREAFRVNIIKPMLSHLSWTGLKRIRPRHFVKLFKKIIEKILSTGKKIEN